MGEPIIHSNYDPGIHSADLSKTINRLNKEMGHKDLSTVIIAPTYEKIPVRVALSWESLIKPPNGRTASIVAEGMEVGEAYSKTIESVLAHPDMGKWKYIFTREHDNLLAPDTLIKLLRHMEEHPEYAAIGALYWTKGQSGCSMCWGDINDPVENFRPQIPKPGVALQETYGLGMGATIFRMELFKDKRLRKPWFKTVASVEEGVGTQDLRAMSDWRKYGYRVACAFDTPVGHLDFDGRFGERGIVY